MIPQGVQVFVALEAIDLRYSFDRLSGLAKEQVGYDPRSGALFVFFGRRRTALKILFFDGSGMCVFYNRLDKKNVPRTGLPDARRAARRDRRRDARRAVGRHRRGGDDEIVHALKKKRTRGIDG
jgi:transposase